MPTDRRCRQEDRLSSTCARRLPWASFSIPLSKLGLPLFRTTRSGEVFTSLIDISRCTWRSSNNQSYKSLYQLPIQYDQLGRQQKFHTGRQHDAEQQAKECERYLYVQCADLQFSVYVYSTVTGDDSVSFVVLYINYPVYVVFAAQLYISSVGI